MGSGQAVTINNAQWKEPPADLVLLSDDIHVWRACLDQPAACIRHLAQTLSADERLRAERFHFERDRLRFITGRGLLRAILGRYLGLEPSQLRFRYSPHGKPALDPSGFQNPLGLVLRFNLAHSRGLVLYAVTRKREIGVDMEYIRPIAEVNQIVERFFTARERAVFRALPISQRQEAFFNGWTRKEAYVKASGRGLDWPLDKIEVSLTPGEPARLLGTDGDHQEALRWFMQTLTPASGYGASLAVEGHGLHLKYWHFEPSRKL